MALAVRLAAPDDAQAAIALDPGAAASDQRDIYYLISIKNFHPGKIVSTVKSISPQADCRPIPL